MMITDALNQMHTISPTRATYRPRYASRGQALIMAVLIMFLLVGLSGLFIAMINHAMVQVARAEERDRLENIAIAGIQMAQNELLHSADGADWRPDNNGPDVNNPGWVHYDKGFYKVTVKYGPDVALDDSTSSLDNPLERYVRVDVQARYALENPPKLDADDPDAKAYEQGFYSSKRYITRKLTALMPIGLTDNLLWVTNLDGSTDPVVLGSTFDVNNGFGDSTHKDLLATVTADPNTLTEDELTDTNVSAPTSKKTSIPALPYVTIYDGPIRADADLEIANAAICLTNSADTNSDATAYETSFAVRRYDEIYVTGNLKTYSGPFPAYSTSPYPTDLQVPVRKLLTKHSNSIADDSKNNIFDNSGNIDSGIDKKLVETVDNNPLIRRIDAPRLDQRDRVTGLDRYRVLTRDSGQLASNDEMIVQGEGLYINNPGDIQHDGDNDKLHTEWLNADNKQPHWKNGVYCPQIPNDGEPGAVEILLGDYGRDQLDNDTTFHQKTMLPDGTTVPADTTVTKGTVVYTLPKVTIRQYTPSGNVLINKEVDYPRNGVIFAEGNIVVKGNLPASLNLVESVGEAGKYLPMADGNDKQVAGGFSSSKNSISYYQAVGNRRYDLSIVSGGTIYIEGNLLSPSTRTNNLMDLEPATYKSDPYWIRSGSERDSKLALLAMDNVCLNPTRAYTIGDLTDIWSGALDFPYWEASNDRDITINYTTAGKVLPQTSLLLWHGGAKAENTDYASIRMLVQGYPYNWHNPAWTFTALNAGDTSVTVTGDINGLVDGSDIRLFDPVQNIVEDAVVSTHNPATGIVTFTAAIANSYPSGGTLLMLTKYPWDELFFADKLQVASDPSHYLSMNSFNLGWLGGGVNAPEEYTQQRYLLSNPSSALSGQTTRYFPALPIGQETALSGYGSLNTLVISWAQGTTPYLLRANTDPTHMGAALNGGDVQVDALVYAQRGSWYVIPGRYYDDDSTAAGSVTDPATLDARFPRYHESLDIKITINGAIVENRPVPLDMEEDSMMHWRGSSLAYYCSAAAPADASTPDTRKPDTWDLTDDTKTGWDASQWRWTKRRMGITYHYDATLMRPVCFERNDDGSVATYLPRLPKLPISPTTFSFGAMRGA